MIKKRFICLLLFVTFCFCAGCGQRVTQISGTVTVDGKPAENLKVLFQAVSNAAHVPSPAYGLTDNAGKYRLTLADDKRNGVIPGEYAVFINWEDPNPATDDNTNHAAPYQIPPSALRGELRYTVKVGEPQTADFHLVNQK
ncbi:MAG: hypothetical protein LBT09_15670 [Planctomycetaceae bacterium]|jgi:hypothetical protein|nr:hypothetical protein [Planctomycetaceae bacterium]